jgi:predicted nucleotide-binding protein (sugar kinase/HSP70/actin superfamily)
MNERIKELERQAEKFVMGIPASLDINEYTSVFNEKFAELIVRECGEALSPMLRDMISRGQAVELIKKHFGVKE